MAEKHNWSMEELRSMINEAAIFIMNQWEEQIDYRNRTGSSAQDLESMRREIEGQIALTKRCIAEQKWDRFALELLPGTYNKIASVQRDVDPFLLTKIYREYGQKRITAFETILEHLKGNFDTEYDRESKIGTITPSSTANIASPGTATGGVVAVPEPKPKHIPLSVLVDEFMNNRVTEKHWTPNTIVNRGGMVRVLCEHFGDDCDISTITRDQIVDLRDNVIRKLPRRRHITPKYRGKSLRELLKMDAPLDERLDVATINDYLAVFGNFFTWCIKYKKTITDSPVFDIKMKQEDPEDDRRKIYSNIELEKIFVELERIPTPSDLKASVKEQECWITLISLYSGMRPNEICQLFVEDILAIDGIACIHINTAHPSKSLKTKTARRVIPIHPLLLKYGFLAHVAQQAKLPPRVKMLKTDPVRLVFPFCNYSKQKRYIRNFSNFFNEFNREHITKDPKKTFYSLRHNFATRMINFDGVEERQVNRLMGHAQQTMTTQIYAKADVKKLKEVISLLEYPFNPMELLRWTPISDEEIAAQVASLPVSE